MMIPPPAPMSHGREQPHALWLASILTPPESSRLKGRAAQFRAGSRKHVISRRLQWWATLDLNQ